MVYWGHGLWPPVTGRSGNGPSRESPLPKMTTMLPILRHSRVSPIAMLIGALFGLPVQAGPNDALHLYGALGYGHDDNLLRVAEGQPAFDNTLGDSWRTSEGGLVFDHMYGRQKINAYAKFSKFKYDHFTQLDYDG